MLRRLRKDTRGVAFIEFALSLPLLMILMTGGIEMGNLVLIKIRTERLARTLSDMVARESGTLDGMSERELNDVLFAAVRNNPGLSLDKDGRIVVTAVLGVDANNDGVPERNAIQWQRFVGKYTAAPVAVGCWKTTTAATLPRARQLVSNEPIYHVQVTQKYQPLLVVLFDAMKVPTEVTDSAMFRGRGSNFRPLMTSLNEPVHDKCDTPDGI